MTPPRTVPPLPQRFFNWVASASISAIDNGRPVTVVTPLPARPGRLAADAHRPRLGGTGSALRTDAFAAPHAGSWDTNYPHPVE